MADKYLECCLELGDNIRPFIQTGQTGKKYLYFRITRRKNGPDQYGKTHNLSIRQKDNSGQYQTYFIGNAIEKEFPNQPQGYGQGQPQGGYAPRGQYNQPQGYAQQPPQGAAEVRQQYQQGYSPQGGYAPQAPAPQNYAPQPPAPQAPAPQGGYDDNLPF